MIRVACPACGLEHECFDALAGMSLRCKKCTASIPIPRVEATAITELPAPSPAPVAAAITPGLPPVMGKSDGITESVRPILDKAFEDSLGPPEPPAEIPDWLLRSWINTWLKMGLKVPEMETRLVDKGCSPRFARWFVSNALETRIGDAFTEQSRALAWSLGLGIVCCLGAVFFLVAAFSVGDVGLVTWAGSLAFFGFTSLVRWYYGSSSAD